MTFRLDQSHPALNALRTLLPAIAVGGGSFGDWLPHPAILPGSSRQPAFHAARAEAVRECLANLLSDVGLPGQIVERAGTGERLWPAGFVGSLTDKGTVVLGAIAPVTEVGSVGIDLEYEDDRPLDEILLGRPRSYEAPVPGHASLLIEFSAKEAVFKAQFVPSRQRLTYKDVTLDWSIPQSSGGVSRLEAMAYSHLFKQPVLVRSATVGPWVVSAALCRAQ